MADLFLGIDTSNYKTSIAVIDSGSETVFARSEYLDVPAGKRGLRQSEAFFMHSNRLPDQIEELSSHIDFSKVRAVGVSSRPRRVEGSYMPCFLSGINAAREIASVLGIPLHQFSHQEGHAAAIIENDTEAIRKIIDDPSESLLYHLSGGTTEFLRCRPDEDGYDLEIIGGTLDISIGQLLDRAGVAMGLPFPSGAYLDDMAISHSGETGHILPKIRINEGRFNLSGAETKLLRTIEGTSPDHYPALIKELFDLTSQLLISSASDLSKEYSADTVYMAGGVASSRYIRDKIASYALSHKMPEIKFGRPELSGDNAVGIARLALRKTLQNNFII